MAGAEPQRPRISGERRVFSLVLALIASPQGLTKRDILQAVHGYADRYRPGVPDEALERQFERDKDQLRELGIPIETFDSPLESGNNQLTRYRISKRSMQMPSEIRFTARELALLRLAALAWREGSLTAESRRAAMKLESLGAGLDVQHIGIAPRLGISEAAAAPLQRAIDEGLVARFAYRLPERDSPLERRVAPLRLHRAEGRWHLIAHDLEREQERVFLLSRIVGAVTVENARFGTGLRSRADAVIEELLALERAQRAVLRVVPGSPAEARLSARSEAREERGDGDERLIEIGTLDYHELAAELAGYGEQVSVLEPSALRERVVALLELVREQHAGRGGAAGPGPAEPAAPAAASRAAGSGRARGRADALQTPDRVILLLALVPYLAEHGETTVAELARAFGAPPERLRELIEFLGTAGVPGETRTYQDEDLFDIDWEALETEDVVRLTRVVAVDDTPRFSPSEQAALAAGLHSLIPLLPEEEREHAMSAADKLAAVGGAPRPPIVSVTADRGDERVSSLAGAIEAGRRVRFFYRDLRGNETERIVDPLALTQSSGAWYLRGYCLDRSAERTFLLDGIRSLQVSSESAEHLAGPDPAPAIGPSEAGTPAVLSLAETALPAVAAFSPRVIGPADEPGWFDAGVDLAYPSAAIRMVQAAPGRVVFRAPSAARAAVLAWADRALSRYSR